LTALPSKSYLPEITGKNPRCTQNRLGARICTLPAAVVSSRSFANSSASPYTNEEGSPAQRFPGSRPVLPGCPYPNRASPRSHPIPLPPRRAGKCPLALRCRPRPPQPHRIRMKAILSFVHRAGTITPLPNCTHSTKDASIPYVCAWWAIRRKPKT
jgi:hypothetical protein